MKMKNIFLSGVAVWLAFACSSPSSTKSDDIERRVDSLLSVMTLEEKLGQMNQVSPGDFE